MPDGAPSNLDAPDVTAALRRTAPDDLAPVNIEALARVGRRRRHRLTALTSVVTVLAVGAAAITLSSRDDPPDVSVNDGSVPLSEPVGTWRQAADPPFEPRMDAFAGTLSDGRMLVWGGHNDTGDQPDSSEMSSGPSDGGIYDPTSDTWEEIPAAPIDTPPPGGATATMAQLVDGQLAIVAFDSNSGIEAAVYDIAERAWTTAPVWEETADYLNYMAWDGETLALVRIDEGEAQIDQPVTVRWQPGDDSWTDGAPFPLGVRNAVGTAFDGSHLAVWGGTEQEFVSDQEHQAFDDGAIYDVAGDTWQPIADGPLSAGTHAEMTWLDGRLIVGGRMGTEAGDGYLGDFAAYDPASETWEVLPEPPQGGVHPSDSSPSFVEDEAALLVADAMDKEGGPEGRWLYTDDGWEQAPLSGLHRIGNLVVADTQTFGNPGSGPFELQVRAAADQWLAATEAPFGNRMSAATATNDDVMLVVGGAEGTDLQLQSDAWVFDLDG